jgi:phosphoribosylformylglycinamidine synthase
VVAVPPAGEAAFAELCRAAGQPRTELGHVTAEQVLLIAGLAPLPLAELRVAWEATLPALFG